MPEEPEIVRVLQVGETPIHVHIHLSTEEVRRVLLPLVIETFDRELRQKGVLSPMIQSDRTTAIPSGMTLPAWAREQEP